MTLKDFYGPEWIDMARAIALAIESDLKKNLGVVPTGEVSKFVIIGMHAAMPYIKKNIEGQSPSSRQ